MRGIVLSDEREATQLEGSYKSTIDPPKLIENHQLGCFAYARNDGDR